MTTSPASSTWTPRAACGDRERAARRDPARRRLVRGHDPRRPHGPRLRRRPQPHPGRGDVAALRVLPGLQPHRRAVAHLPQPRGGGERPAPGHVPGERERPGRAHPAQLRARRRRLARSSSPRAAAAWWRWRWPRASGPAGSASWPSSAAGTPRRRRAATPRGLRVSDFADLVLDTGAPAGDAMVAIPGLATPVGPGSTVGGCLLINAIKAEVAARLTAAGHPPTVLTGSAIVGAERSAALFEAAYDEHARRLARLLDRTMPGKD